MFWRHIWPFFCSTVEFPFQNESYVARNHIFRLLQVPGKRSVKIPSTKVTFNSFFFLVLTQDIFSRNIMKFPYFLRYPSFFIFFTEKENFHTWNADFFFLKKLKHHIYTLCNSSFWLFTFWNLKIVQYFGFNCIVAKAFSRKFQVQKSDSGVYIFIICVGLHRPAAC